MKKEIIVLGVLLILFAGCGIKTSQMDVSNTLSPVKNFEIKEVRR
jgi:hypothetical protein